MIAQLPASLCRAGEWHEEHKRDEELISVYVAPSEVNRGEPYPLQPPGLFHSTFLTTVCLFLDTVPET